MQWYCCRGMRFLRSQRSSSICLTHLQQKQCILVIQQHAHRTVFTSAGPFWDVLVSYRPTEIKHQNLTNKSAGPSEKTVHFLTLTDRFVILSATLLKPHLGYKQQQLSGPGKYG